jgi:CheY-like chemotaxis protein
VNCCNVLIADGDDDNFEILRSAFDSLEVKHHLRQVKDGQILLDHLNQLTAGRKPPPPYLLDINMTVIDGLKALNIIRKNYELKYILVLIHIYALRAYIEPGHL